MNDTQMNSEKRPDILGLNAFELFKDFEEDSLHLFEADVQVINLSKGSVLFEQGDHDDSLYLVAKGLLDISVRYPDGGELSVDHLEAGSSLGEMALLTGQVRTATVRAIADSTLYKITRSSFDHLVTKYPDLENGLANLMASRTNGLIGGQVIRNLFGNLDPAALKELEQQFTWQHLHSGEILYYKGDPGDSMAIVVNGRLQVVVEQSGGKPRVVAEHHRGMIIGEIGLLTGVPRTTAVYAVRDTDLLVLTRANFEKLIHQYPHVMLEISRILATRLYHTTQMLARELPQQISVALVPSSRSLPMSQIMERVSEVLNAFGPVLYLNADRFASMYPRSNVGFSESESLANPMITSWLDQQESQYPYLLLETDQVWTPWSARCIGHADTIYFFARADEPPNFSAIEASISQSSSRAQWELVLVHPEGQKTAHGTQRWLQDRPFIRYHHLRLDNPSDYRRLARGIARRSNGLVLSGGGARGYAHLGAYRALSEAGIEIDVVGGTSVGSLLGAALICFEDYQELIEEISVFSSSKRLMDFTFPVVALNATRKITNMLRGTFKEMRIEDMWRSYFCVSTNLSVLQPVIHRQGVLWEAIRASIAAPGVFSPMSKNGEILVDGGLVNNLPIDIMRETCEGGLVIAVNVAQAQETTTKWDLPPSISGWQMLFNRFNPFAQKIQAPSLTDTLMRTVDMVTQYKLQETMGMADLIIVPDVEHINTMEWEAWQDGIERGYQAAKIALEGWEHNNL